MFKNTSVLKLFRHGRNCRIDGIPHSDDYLEMDVLENDRFYKLFHDPGMNFNLFHGWKVKKRQVL